MEDIQLTKHFSFFEFTKCPNHPDLQEKNREMALPFKDNLIECAKMLEIVRLNFNVRVFLNSGFRCPEVNEIEKGSVTSQHLRGAAADFRVEHYDSPYETDMVCNWILQKSGIKFGQLINEGRYGPDGDIVSWIHCSICEDRSPEKCGQYLVNKQRM